MRHEDFKNYKTEDFILHQDFVHWALHPEDPDNSFWAELRAGDRQLGSAINDAIFIVRNLRATNEDISEKNIEEIFTRIQKTKASNIQFRKIFLRAAAVLLVALGVGAYGWYSVSQKGTPFQMVQADKQSFEKGVVILADGSKKEFDTEDTSIEQNADGKLSVNSETIEMKNVPEQGTNAMNTIIVPYGKRSVVTLADGTRIKLNSGSQLSYPTNFNGNTREVFLLGEAFFDVAKDAKRPFMVNSQNLTIKVLGTKFNVSGYPEENTIQTVLVEGKVTIGENKIFAKPVAMVPGQRMIYGKEDKSISKENVDVQLYTSWVNGYLIFENEPTPLIFKKLERYYDKKINFGSGLENITFSGKLDLKEDLNLVLENIAFASNIKIFKTENQYTIVKP